MIIGQWTFEDTFYCLSQFNNNLELKQVDRDVQFSEMAQIFDRSYLNCNVSGKNLEIVENSELYCIY